MDRIVAITVTFNDYVYLEKSLNALRQQSIPIYKIVVVDNASNKENKQRLKSQSDWQVEILWLDENRGGAGGFEEGMRYVQEKYDPDWYWLMDADAYPRKDCAERLLEQKNYCGDIGILAPLIYGIDLKEYQLYHHKREARFLYRDIQMYHSYGEVPSISTIEADAFVGPMVARRAVRDVGIPDGQLFIYGDDIEYTYRISRKYKVLLIRNAVMYHRDQPVNGEQKPENWWKDYYTFRNRILFIRKYNLNACARTIGICLLGLRFYRRLINSYRMKYPEHMKRMRRKLLRQSMMDGFKGISGKTVDPMAFREQLNQMGNWSIE